MPGPSSPPEVPLRILFSAHGLPESIVRRGDPYQWQVEQTVAAVVAQLDIPDLDHAICYQSRVTPQKWIGPSTEAELERAAHDRVAVLVCPIAFVSEHSETLVELDVEYREEARAPRRARLFPGAGAEQRPRLHRRPGATWCCGRGPAAGALQLRRRPAMPEAASATARMPRAARLQGAA